MNKGKLVQDYIIRYLNGDMDALNEVVPHIEGIIKSIITKYCTVFSYGDLYQVGWLGVMRSLQTYDPSKGILFITYCYRGVTYAVKQYIQNENKAYKTEYTGEYRRNVFSLDRILEADEMSDDYGHKNISYHAVTSDDTHNTENEAYMNILKEQVIEIIHEFTSDVQRQILQYHMDGKNGKWISDELSVSAGYVSTTIKKFNELCVDKLINK